MKKTGVAIYTRVDVHKKARALDGNIVQSNTEDSIPSQDVLARGISAIEGIAEVISDGGISASDMSLSDFSADDASVTGEIQPEYASVNGTAVGDVSVVDIVASEKAIPNDASDSELSDCDISMVDPALAGDDQPKDAPIDDTSIDNTSIAGDATVAPDGNIYSAEYSNDPTYPYNHYTTSDEQGSDIAHATYYQQYQHLYQHATQHPYPHPYLYIYPYPYYYHPSDSDASCYELSTWAADPQLDYNAMKSSLRTIFLRNLPKEVRIHQILDLVKKGIVESAKLLEPKHCAFISFVDVNAAHAFHSQAQRKKLKIQKQELSVGWGKSTVIPPTVAQALEQGASRNVFLGGIDNTFTEEELCRDFSELGVVDTIKIVHEKAIAFVHLTHIASAVKAVAVLQVLKPRYSSLRISYGKDRCAKFADLTAPLSSRLEALKAQKQGGSDSNSKGIDMSILTKEAQRTVYLGNIDPDATCENLCNAIRGGILSNILYQQSKHCAFVTFVDPAAAAAFFDMVSTEKGLVFKRRKRKVGWGTNAALSLPVEVIQAFMTGATRNDLVDVEGLRKDFSEYGEVEQVNILKEKDCAFVNFTNVLSAVKAVENIKSKPDYINLRISYGKDRCGNSMRERKEEAAWSDNSPRRKRRDTQGNVGTSAGVKNKVGTEESGSSKGSVTKGSTSKPVSKGKAARKAANKAANKLRKRSLQRARKSKRVDPGLLCASLPPISGCPDDMR
ncbi:hypothetical protein BGZ68_001044 [Mortierella alpina]|nr:hypothetical protein BGZ68_001044 [Mortierella alpina]